MDDSLLILAHRDRPQFGYRDYALVPSMPCYAGLDRGFADDWLHCGIAVLPFHGTGEMCPFSAAVPTDTLNCPRTMAAGIQSDGNGSTYRGTAHPCHPKVKSLSLLMGTEGLGIVGGCRVESCNVLALALDLNLDLIPTLTLFFL